MIDFLISYLIAGVLTLCITLLWVDKVRGVDIEKEIRSQSIWANIRDICAMTILWPMTLALMISTSIEDYLKKRNK